MQDFHDFAAQAGVALPSAALFLDPGQDEVAMKGRGGVFAGDVKIGFGGIDRNEETESTFVHLQAPDAKPETPGQHVKAVADLHDAPGFFFLGEECGKGTSVFRRNAEPAGERLFVHRLVVGISQQRNKAFAPMEGRRRFRFVNGITTREGGRA